MKTIQSKYDVSKTNPVSVNLSTKFQSLSIHDVDGSDSPAPVKQIQNKKHYQRDQFHLQKKVSKPVFERPTDSSLFNVSNTISSSKIPLIKQS